MWQIECATPSLKKKLSASFARNANEINTRLVSRKGAKKKCILCAFVDIPQKLVRKTRFSRDFVAQASSL
jgi:hypothetical protein